MKGCLQLLFLGLLTLLSTQSQAQSFKFPVTEEGMYLLPFDRLESLGFTDKSQIALFGYPGRMPQHLDSSQLEWTEIPSLVTNDGLLAFLSGPSTLIPKEEGSFSLRNHYYTDTLYYVVSSNPNPKRIAFAPDSIAPTQTARLYQWTSIKKEEINLLNSGRNWYDKPIRAGSIRSFTVRQATPLEIPWKIQAKIMGQSRQAGQLSLLVNNQVIARGTLPPISTNRYATKGIEIDLKESFQPSRGEVNTLELLLESPDSEAGAYLDYLLIGKPYESDALVPGIYYSEGETNFSNRCESCQIWEISDFYFPLSFSRNTQIYGKKWAVFDQESIQQVDRYLPIDKNLRIPGNWPELIIISPRLLLPEAEKLVTHKLGQGIFARAVALQDIYDQFGYGNPDIVAIRNFLAWHFHTGKQLKNVLLYGKGTFDYKGKLGGRPNLIPTYSSRNSLDPLLTYSSDDFFGLLGYGQGAWEESREGDEKLQIGVGRLPVISRKEADQVLKKIIQYESPAAKEDWNRRVAFIADDGDGNTHLRDAEFLSNFLFEEQKGLRHEKIYLDRFEQVDQSAPQAEQALLEVIREGALFLNYIGHGNETTLTEEEVFRIESVENWPEQEHLPLWVVATCEFGRQDSPLLRSGAEELLIAEKKGAIGLFATGRPVFSSVNFSLNEAFIREVFRKIDGTYQDLGSIIKNTKNASLNGSLNRNFSLLGDPSLTLNYPDLELRLESFQNEAAQEIDTLRSFSKINFQGRVIDPISERFDANFNGTYELEILDIPEHIRTKGDESSPVEFPEYGKALYRGTGQVNQGIVEGEFRLPSGLVSTTLQRRLRLYAVDPHRSLDASSGQDVLLAGEGTAPMDEQGPIIRLQAEGQTAPPFLFEKNQFQANFQFLDSTGIDISGRDPSRSIILRVNESAPIVLNSHYRGVEGSFRMGTINFLIEGLQEGINSVEIQASDLLGNTTQERFRVDIRGSTTLRILDHYFFPNPASQESTLLLQHNRPGENLMCKIDLYSPNGRILISKSVRLLEANPVIHPFRWYFLQKESKIPAKGSYIYRLTLLSEVDFTKDSVSGKILIE